MKPLPSGGGWTWRPFMCSWGHKSETISLAYVPYYHTGPWPTWSPVFIGEQLNVIECVLFLKIHCRRFSVITDPMFTAGHFPLPCCSTFFWTLSIYIPSLMFVTHHRSRFPSLTRSFLLSHFALLGLSVFSSIYENRQTAHNFKPLIALLSDSAAIVYSRDNT